MAHNPLQIFGQNSGLLIFDQAIAERATGASITDQNSWNRDRLIPTAERSERRFYAGVGILHLAVVQQLAWAIGPKRAAEIGLDLTNLAHDFCKCAASGKPTLARFERMFLVIEAPGMAHKTAAPVRLESAELPRPQLGLPFYVIEQPDEEPPTSLAHANLSVRLGSLWRETATRAGKLIVEAGRAK